MCAAQVLFTCGALEALPSLIRLIEPLRAVKDLHLTLVRQAPSPPPLPPTSASLGNLPPSLHLTLSSNPLALILSPLHLRQATSNPPHPTWTSSGNLSSSSPCLTFVSQPPSLPPSTSSSSGSYPPSTAASSVNLCPSLLDLFLPAQSLPSPPTLPPPPHPNPLPLPRASPSCVKTPCLIRNENAYYCCIAQLASSLPLPLPPLPSLYIVGDSHVLSPAWRTVRAEQPDKGGQGRGRQEGRDKRGEEGEARRDMKVK